MSRYRVLADGKAQSETDKTADENGENQSPHRLQDEVVAEREKQKPGGGTIQRAAEGIGGQVAAAIKGFPNPFIGGEKPPQPPAEPLGKDISSGGFWSSVFPKTREGVEKDHGVTITERDGKLEVSRDSKPLFSVEKSDTAFGVIDRVLDISKTHGVEISTRDGQLRIKGSNGEFSVENNDGGLARAQSMLNLARANHGWFKDSAKFPGMEQEFWARDNQGREIKLFNTGANPGGLEKASKILEVSSKYGVQIRSDNFTHKYVAIMNGEEKVLAETTATEDGLQKASKQLEEMVAAKKKQIEETFPVNIAQGGGKDWAGRPTREPTIPELAGLEIALHKSQTDTLYMVSNPRTREAVGTVAQIFDALGNLISGGPGVGVNPVSDRVGIYFVSEEWGLLGQESNDSFQNKRLAIFKHYYATQADAAKAGDPLSRGTVEDTAMHELAHAGQASKQWDQDAYAAKMGWVKRNDRWCLTTADGNAYRLEEQTGTWIKVDQQGTDVAADQPDARLDGDKMAQRAKIKPVSDYFPNPADMFAEGLRAYRQGGVLQEKLYKESKNLYAAIKEFDDQALRDAYGTDENGNQRYIRNGDGYIVANTRENQETTLEHKYGFGVDVPPPVEYTTPPPGSPGVQTPMTG